MLDAIRRELGRYEGQWVLPVDMNALMEIIEDAIRAGPLLVEDGCAAIAKTGRLQMALDRLVSDGPAIVKRLRQEGYHNLALRTQHDIEAIAAWLSSGRPEEEA